MCRFGSPVCQLFHGRAIQLLGRSARTLQGELLRGGKLVLELETGRARETGDTGNPVLVHQALGAAGKRETKCNLFADSELAGVKEPHAINVSTVEQSEWLCGRSGRSGSTVAPLLSASRCQRSETRRLHASRERGRTCHKRAGASLIARLK